MPPELPYDVLLHITEKVPDERSSSPASTQSRRNLHNLALTCRQLHQMTMPFIYHSLSFRVYSNGQDESWRERELAGLIRDLTRARLLLRSPQPLRHVQQLTLEGWDIYDYREVISEMNSLPEDDADNSMASLNPKNMILAIYDVITRLVLHMPQLRRLVLLQSHITPMLYAAMSSRLRLTSFSLILRSMTMLQQLSSPIDLPITLRIQELTYYNAWKDASVDRNFSYILDQCVMNLHTLSVTSIHLPLLTSHVCNRTIPLKALDVQNPFEEPPADDVTFALWDVLRATPELRTLCLRGYFSEYGFSVLPPDDLGNHLCNLSQLSASPITILMLTEGRELDVVEINESFRISGLSITEIVSCSPTHLSHLTLKAIDSRTQQDLDKFICSFHVFQCLEYLSIDYRLLDVFKGTYLEFHESWKVINNLWQELKHLQSFNLHRLTIFHTRLPYGIAVACPVDTNDGPLSRGHPNLIRIGVSFLNDTLWEWHSEHGWVSRQWSYSAWYDE